MARFNYNCVAYMFLKNAGDSFVGAFVSALLHNCMCSKSVVCGINAACLTLQSERSVSPDISSVSVGITHE